MMSYGVRRILKCSCKSIEALQVSFPILRHPLSAINHADHRHRTEENPTLVSEVHKLFVERQMKPDLGEYSNLLLLHGVYQELFKVKSYLDRGLSGWVPSIPQLGHLNPAAANGGSASDRERQNTLASWRSAAMDCVDVLHWAANGVVAQLLGAEHATVFHLHFSRVVLFSPYSKIRALASGLASLAETPQGSPLTQREATLKLESEVLEWAQRDEVSNR